ncbi:hypothetical protein T440DRAFT_523738 [Plenodomus tracheiphilus IPT5]|uniref:FAD/NAD(P)-binding domain-containing protein n=1 Tax=Plenodomus tracheiphilus IPT5 TaxID=1408161 RepID=A0A6A7AP74_9PLEO|nr:hypothetical protein T440DRAFT_523738 [Plenodomus tracheiphilus IPT5]
MKPLSEIERPTTQEFHPEPETKSTHSLPVFEESFVKEAPVENFRPLKVVVIGAGFSGIYMNIRIPELLRNVDLVTYEKNDGIGGTWLTNRYPGCGCDIPGPLPQTSTSDYHQGYS